MGSYGDEWLRCAWCWRWGKCLLDEFLDGAEPLIDIDMVGTLCERCFELEEPPWRPNNRQRYARRIRALWLRRVLGNREVGEVSLLIASYLAANEP